MARHKTHKTTAQGKAQTQTRRHRRLEKYRATTLDTAQLMRDLTKGA